MVTEPAATPLTEPVEEPTVATELLLLLQIPPVVGTAPVTDRVVTPPCANVLAPEITPAFGIAVTVIVFNI